MCNNKSAKIKNLDDRKQSLKNLYYNNLIGFLEKPCLNYCHKVSYSFLLLTHCCYPANKYHSKLVCLEFGKALLIFFLSSIFKINLFSDLFMDSPKFKLQDQSKSSLT